jgi:acyl-CoA thioesterase FadM
VASRSEAQWRRILTPARMKLVDALLEQDQDLSLAATRVWSLLETLLKIDADAVDAAPEIVHRQGEAVVFSVATSAGPLFVATLPMKFALGVTRVLATRVYDRKEAVAAEQPSYETGMEKTLSGPQGQAVFSLRQPLAFKDMANLGKGVYFSNYFNWMGKARELPLKPVYDELVPQFTSGKWGMVTNNSKIVYVDEAAGSDMLETRTWLGPDRFDNGASFTLHYEWHKQTPDGEKRLVAFGEQSTSWVEIVGHGQVELRPAPDYLNEFFDRSGILPRNEQAYLPPVHESAPLAGTDLGAQLYCAPAGPKIEPRLEQVVFQTTLEDANLVGNIYFANYAVWQGRVRDQFFHGLAPQLYNGGSRDGELFCIESSVDHLREAMPFDRIEVHMSLKTLYANGLVLWFDYYRRTPQDELQKLATGEHKCLWVRHDRNNQLVPNAMPADLIDPLGAYLGERRKRVLSSRGLVKSTYLGKREALPGRAPVFSLDNHK